MRDINRLDNFYDNLKSIHKNYIPGWRFGQFILNFMSWYYDKYKTDIFYIEEDKMIKYINDFIDEVKRNYY